jgi:hypothetical protein
VTSIVFRRSQSIHVDLDSIEWTPGSAYKGLEALYQDQEVFYRKVLSDRRQEDGGLAVLQGRRTQLGRDAMEWMKRRAGSTERPRMSDVGSTAEEPMVY